MIDLRSTTDRVEIEALRAEFVDAVMMHDYDRLASLFTGDGAVRMPHIDAAAVGREQIRAGVERLQGRLNCFVQTTHPGTIQLDGDVASGRAYIFELMHSQDHGSNLNHGIYHDRYRRTPDGWKFTERTYQVTYVDVTPLAGSAPSPAERPRENVSGGVTA
jgi:ketosteroid isomerase-like protein